MMVNLRLPRLEESESSLALSSSHCEGDQGERAAAGDFPAATTRDEPDLLA